MTEKPSPTAGGAIFAFSGNEIPVVAMETVPTVRRIMDIGTDDGTMGMDMIGAVNCAAMVGAAANAHAISVFVV